ncbi:MAG: YicC/YloC family endoribonuclease [Candidatus Polarisedimenticolia bacterium]
MTGFGRGEAGEAGYRVTVEMRSVNHRFAEFKMRVPPEIAGFEHVLSQRLQKNVGRGRVDVLVNVARAENGAGAFEINRPLVRSFVEAARTLREEFGLEGAVTLSSVLSLPDVLRVRSGAQGLGAAEQKVLLDAFDRAVAAHDAMRVQEGKILARDLNRRVVSIRALARGITKRVPGQSPLQARRMRARVKELMGGTPGRSIVDPARIAQEVAILAERSDITEELVRVDGHLEQIEGLLSGASGPIGKRLDFILQELHREANTMNSKSIDLRICQAAIEIKAEVEKIREQVQNVE